MALEVCGDRVQRGRKGRDLSTGIAMRTQSLCAHGVISDCALHKRQSEIRSYLRKRAATRTSRLCASVSNLELANTTLQNHPTSSQMQNHAHCQPSCKFRCAHELQQHIRRCCQCAVWTIFIVAPRDQNDTTQSSPLSVINMTEYVLPPSNGAD